MKQTLLALLAIFTVLNAQSQSTLQVECHQSPTNSYNNQILMDGNLLEYDLCSLTPSFYVSIIDTNCTAWGTKSTPNNANLNNDFGNYNNDGGCRQRVEYYFIYRQNDSLDLVHLDSLLNYWIPNGHTIAIWTPISYDYASIASIYPPLATTLNDKWGANVQTSSMLVLFGVEGDSSSFSVDTLTSGTHISVTKTICSQSSLGLNELLPIEKKLIIIIDLMGRETEFIPNTPLIYLYNDGSRERVIRMED